MKHAYSDILIAIANGEQIELRNSLDQWEPINTKVTLVHISGGVIPPDRYRVKPKIVLINGHEVPEPVREPLKYGSLYWTVNTGGPTQCVWDGYAFDLSTLANGWIHLTKEEADAHFKALVSFTKKDETCLK